MFDLDLSPLDVNTVSSFTRAIKFFAILKNILLQPPTNFDSKQTLRYVRRVEYFVNFGP